MYKEKWLKGFCKKSGKSIALLVSLVLIIGVIVGGAIAFLMDTTGPVNNQFTPSKVTTEVVEDITSDPTKKQDVKIQNTGDTEAWIRAAVVVTWQDKDGNVYGKAPVEGSDKDYTIFYNIRSDVKADCWVEGNDGFYYWTSPVAANGQTGDLIKSCTYKANAPDGYSLTVEIIGSGIQSKPANVFNTEWASSGLHVKDKDDLGNALDPMQWTLK